MSHADDLANRMIKISEKLIDLIEGKYFPSTIY